MLSMRSFLQRQPCIRHGSGGDRIGSKLPNRLDKHGLKVSQHLFGTPTGNLLEVMDHMHLVVVSEVLRDLGPGLPSR
jgi:hypothetical protein